MKREPKDENFDFFSKFRDLFRSEFLLQTTLNLRTIMTYPSLNVPSIVIIFL